MTFDVSSSQMRLIFRWKGEVPLPDLDGPIYIKDFASSGAELSCLNCHAEISIPYRGLCFACFDDTFAPSGAKTSAAGANGHDKAEHSNVVIDSAKSPAADIEKRQAAEYMAEVLLTTKRKAKRLAQQVPARFHGELFDLAIQAARAVGKWEYVNQVTSDQS